MPFEVYRVWGLEFVELNLETFTKINYFTCYTVVCVCVCVTPGSTFSIVKYEDMVQLTFYCKPVYMAEENILVLLQAWLSLKCCLRDKKIDVRLSLVNQYLVCGLIQNDLQLILW